MAYLMTAWIVLFSVFISQPVGAVLMERPKVEYSADETLQTEDMSVEQKIFYTPTKERKELKSSSMDAGVDMVQIFRHDNKVLWQVMPSQKMYMEHPFGQSGQQQGPPDLSKWDFEETVVGEEVVEGLKVTKYKTIATSTDGKKFGGFSWRTKEGIPMKMDLLFKEGTEKTRMTTGLKNVKIGKQDPSLFEIPSGFTKLDMAGMMGGMMGGQGAGRRNIPAAPREIPEPSASAGDEGNNQNPGEIMKREMMKKMFGR